MESVIINNIDIWSPGIIILLIVSGFAVGVVNTLAGSGTAISYAVFMLLGLPPSYANGSVRLGVITQTLAATMNFHKHRFLEIRKASIIGIPVTLGSVVGAEIAAKIDQDLFKIIVGIAMILMFFILFYKPEHWIVGRNHIKNSDVKWWHFILYFFIGVYGGFIHIGVGIFLLAALVLVSGYNLLHANSFKVYIVLMYSPFALGVFMFNGDIHYGMALISTIGNTLGGIIASKYAIHYGAKALRWFLLLVLIVFSSYLFGLFEFIQNLFS